MSPADLLKAKPTFASSVILAGERLNFFRRLCVQMCRFACVFVERASKRWTPRNVPCSFNRWGLFTPAKSTLIESTSATLSEREREQTSLTDHLYVAIYLLHIYYSYYILDANVLWPLINSVLCSRLLCDVSPNFNSVS